MKLKIFTLALSSLIATSLMAQNAEDALKYGFVQQGGTARNLATGGAMASLGGEFSSLFVNPAGLSFYRTKEFVFTPKVNMYKNKNLYRTNSSTTKTDAFDIGASGLIIGSPVINNAKNKPINFAFGIGVNQVADFNNSISYSGKNNYSSYTEKYLEELIKTNSTDPNRAAYSFPNTSSLALNTYLVDPIMSGGNVVGYKSHANNALSAGLLQTNTINTKGGTYDVSIGGAVNVEEKWHFGASGSLLITDYERNQIYTEKEATPIANNGFKSFSVTDQLKTSGMGFNVKLGAIYRPTTQVRLGLAIHTPTSYDLTETQNTTLTTDTENYHGIQTQSSKDVINYQNITLGLNVTDRLKYNLNTPWRFMLSGSYVFREIENTKKQRAFITADIEYLNYRNVSYNASDEEDVDYDDYLKTVKASAKQMYRGAFNARLGGELKLNVFMIRAGLAYYGNPMKDKVNLKTNRLNASAGIGYRNKGFFIDATYVHSTGKSIDRPYILEDRENTIATIKPRVGTAMLTFGVKF
jgi:hypothetical protein